jgi:hypothetical protein
LKYTESFNNSTSSSDKSGENFGCLLGLNRGLLSCSVDSSVHTSNLNLFRYSFYLIRAKAYLKKLVGKHE